MQDQLKEQRIALLAQRAQLKDNLEAIDRVLGQINFALQILEAQAKVREEEEPQPDPEDPIVD